MKPNINSLFAQREKYLKLLSSLEEAWNLSFELSDDPDTAEAIIKAYEKTWGELEAITKGIIITGKIQAIQKPDYFVVTAFDSRKKHRATISVPLLKDRAQEFYDRITSPEDYLGSFLSEVEIKPFKTKALKVA